MGVLAVAGGLLAAGADTAVAEPAATAAAPAHAAGSVPRLDPWGTVPPGDNPAVKGGAAHRPGLPTPRE